MTPALPSVSAHCITYGRNQCLQEAIQFFLDQDYAGPKELVIVNDLPEQRLVFEHPEVRILNLPERAPSIGEKRNLAISECTGEILVCWDDDDGFLADHITSCVRYLADSEYAKPDTCFLWTRNTSFEITHSFIAQHVFTREAFYRSGGYPAINSGQDKRLDAELRRVSRCNEPTLRPHEVTYLFRWGNGEYHLSAHGQDSSSGGSGFDIIGESVARQLASGALPRGEVRLRPTFRLEYYRLVANYLRTLASS
jgi:glycosyltransferase involved in cell wall biosynthesis